MREETVSPKWCPFFVKMVLHPHPAFGHILPLGRRKSIPCVLCVPWSGLRLAKRLRLALDGDVEVAVDFYEALVVPELGEVESWTEEEDAELFLDDTFLEECEGFVLFADGVVDHAEVMLGGGAFAADLLEGLDDGAGFVVSSREPEEHALGGEVGGVVAKALGGAIGDLKCFVVFTLQGEGLDFCVGAEEVSWIQLTSSAALNASSSFPKAVRILT